MSTYSRISRKCSICGRESEHNKIASTNTFGGADDLDLRPPEMYRSTMSTWVEECPYCGYASYDISECGGDINLIREYIGSEEYRSCDGMNFKGKDAPKFYRNYMIYNYLGQIRPAGNSLRYAAWECDDTEGEEENAVSCRKLLIPVLEEMTASYTADNLTEYDSAAERIAILADAYRRTGRFDDVLKLKDYCNTGNESLNRLILFQILLSVKKDTACHTTDDVYGVLFPDM